MSYGYMGNSSITFDYEHKKKEIYEKFANKECRATLVSIDKIGYAKLKPGPTLCCLQKISLANKILFSIRFFSFQRSFKPFLTSNN